MMWMTIFTWAEFINGREIFKITIDFIMINRYLKISKSLRYAFELELEKLLD